MITYRQDSSSIFATKIIFEDNKVVVVCNPFLKKVCYEIADRLRKEYGWNKVEVKER